MERNDTAAGVFAALVVLMVFGIINGFPDVVWALLGAGFAGVFVATGRRRERVRVNSTPVKGRPWNKE